jgi:hypothetical protein
MGSRSPIVDLRERWHVLANIIEAYFLAWRGLSCGCSTHSTLAREHSEQGRYVSH